MVTGGKIPYACKTLLAGESIFHGDSLLACTELAILENS